MPGRDRTGPDGKGPKTGWGLGDCNKVDTQIKDQLRTRRSDSPGRGRGRFGDGGYGPGGMGRGHRHGFYGGGWPLWKR